MLCAGKAHDVLTVMAVLLFNVNERVQLLADITGMHASRYRANALSFLPLFEPATHELALTADTDK